MVLLDAALVVWQTPFIHCFHRLHAAYRRL
jgi:hypothetical protein